MKNKQKEYMKKQGLDVDDPFLEKLHREEKANSKKNKKKKKRRIKGPENRKQFIDDYR